MLPELKSPRGVTIRMIDQHQEGKPVGGLGIDQRIGAFGEDAEQQPAEHGGRGLLGAAADHHGDESEGAEGIAEIGIGEGAGPDQHARHPREEPGGREGHDRDHGRVRADGRGHLGIRRDRHAQLPEQGALADQLETDA